MMEKVSIIIPIYNVEDYIERCISSILCQSYHNLEIILIDDCSTDKSMEIAINLINEFEKPDDMVFVFKKHDKNLGLSAARNTGILSSHGEYLFFLDSDDEIVPDSLSILIGLATKYPDAELVQGTVKSVPHKKHYDMSFYKDVEYTDDNEWITKNFFNVNHSFPINAWNKLVKREFIFEHHLFFKEGLVHEDELWTFQIMEKLRKIVFCHQITLIHYSTPNSIMNTTKKTVSAGYMAVIFDEIKPQIDQKFFKLKYEYFLKRFVYWYNEFHVLTSYKKLYNYFLKTSVRKGFLRYTILLILLRLSFLLGRGNNYITYLITKS